MREKQIEVIENCIKLLKTTLGAMTSPDADRIVKSVSEILEVACENLRQIK